MVKAGAPDRQREPSVIPKGWWELIHNSRATAVLDILTLKSIATGSLRVQVGHAELADELGLPIDDEGYCQAAYRAEALLEDRGFLRRVGMGELGKREVVDVELEAEIVEEARRARWALSCPYTCSPVPPTRLAAGQCPGEAAGTG